MHATVTISPRSSSGFTLVEVLMAMLIMTVGLLGLLQSVNVAYEHNLRNKLREEAVLIAEEKMNDPSFPSVTTVSRVIVGASKKFIVTKDALKIGDSNRLKVTVRWGFKNVSSIHEIYSIKKT